MAADKIDLEAGLATSPQYRLHAAVGLLESERERFFLWSPVCLGLGIAAYFAMPIEPQLGVAFAPLALVLILRAVSSTGTLSSTVLAALILAGLGFADAKLRVESVRAPVLAKSLHNAEITGVVTLVETKYSKGQRLTIGEPKIAGLAAEKTPAFVRVRTMSARSVAEPGDRIRLKATLAPPAKPALPGGFDHARTAWFDQVGGVGYAFAAPVIEGHADGGTLSQHYRRGIETVRRRACQSRVARRNGRDCLGADHRRTWRHQRRHQ